MECVPNHTKLLQCEALRCIIAMRSGSHTRTWAYCAQVLTLAPGRIQYSGPAPECAAFLSGSTEVATIGPIWAIPLGLFLTIAL